MKKKLTPKEKIMHICEFVKVNHLGYPEAMRIPNYLKLRIKGLHEGKFIANKKRNARTVPYDFLTIGTACKKSIGKARDYLGYNSHKINDERHRINIVMNFIEEEAQEIENHRIASEKALARMDFRDMSHLFHEGATYKKRSNIPVTKEMDEDWW